MKYINWSFFDSPTRCRKTASICRRIIYRRYFQICERATDDIVCCLLACTITVPSELLFKVIDVAGDAKLIPPTGKKLIIRLKSRLRYSYSLYEYIGTCAYEEYIHKYRYIKVYIVSVCVL